MSQFGMSYDGRSGAVSLGLPAPSGAPPRAAKPSLKITDKEIDRFSKLYLSPSDPEHRKSTSSRERSLLLLPGPADFKGRKDILTLGGTANSISTIAVPMRSERWMRFASAAATKTAEATHPLAVDDSTALSTCVSSSTGFDVSAIWLSAAAPNLLESSPLHIPSGRVQAALLRYRR